MTYSRHGEGGLHGERPSEHRQGGHSPAVLLLQVLPNVLERGLEAAVPDGSVAAVQNYRPGVVLEEINHLVDARPGGTAGGQFDAQRRAFHQPAYLDDGRRLLLGQPVVPPHLTSSQYEEADRRVTLCGCIASVGWVA